MHFPSEFILSHMGLAEAGMWATKVNDGRQTVFVVKLSTDALKWIHRGVQVNLLVGHVTLDSLVIRVLGLEIFDCQTDPLLPNLPQVEAWEIKEFDELLALDRFTVHFHNEQPFLSVLDATASLPGPAVRSYLEKPSALTFHSTPVVTSVFRSAQRTFEKALSRSPEDAARQVEIFRFSMLLSNLHWNSMGVPDAGTFVPNDSNEGESHEALLLHVLKPNFDGEVIASPKIPDGNTTRELCDLLAISKNAFVFEAKAFSVFDKPLDQTSDRKAATVMKHFGKALGQLQGAIKRIEKGVEIQADGSTRPLTIAGKQFGTLHGIIVVSNTSFDLPWLEIGKQLAEAQHVPRTCYHLLQLAEVQRMVAFAAGSSDALNQILVRRAEVVASSKDAHIRTDYRPEVTSVLKRPPVSGGCLGIRFVWVGADVADSLVRFFPMVYQQFQTRAFSGRLDFYHKVGKVQGSPAIGVGMAAQSISQPLDHDWWMQFRHDLFDSVTKAGLPQVAANSERLQTLGEIVSKYPELLLAVEFQDGYVIAKNSGEDT
jgi:hypothetical protein